MPKNLIMCECVRNWSLSEVLGWWQIKHDNIDLTCKGVKWTMLYPVSFATFSLFSQVLIGPRHLVKTDWHWILSSGNCSEGSTKKYPVVRAESPLPLVLKVWSITQFYSVDFSQSSINVKKCVFNKRTDWFASAVYDSVMGPPCLGQHTWQPPCIYVLLKSTHVASWGPMKGAV